MEHKPWPLIILAFIHIIEPITKINFYSLYYQLTPLEVVLRVYQSNTAIQIFEFFLLFPIAGLALFAVKKWSYLVFFIAEIWVLTINFSYLNDLYQTNQMMMLGFFVSFTILNLVFVSYLLLPAVRNAYLHPRTRWWESKPRYSVNFDCKVDGKSIGTIRNISSGGVFIETDSKLLIKSKLMIEFNLSIESETVKIRTRSFVLNKFEINNTQGYGAKFIETTRRNKKLLKKTINHLEKSHSDR